MSYYPRRAISVLAAVLYAISLLAFGSGVSRAASLESAVPSLVFRNNSYWSGYHVSVRPNSRGEYPFISSVQGTWKIQCEYTSSKGPLQGGAHGTWVGLGGVTSSTNVKLGSAVNLANGDYSYLWYQGIDGVSHPLGQFKCSPTVKVTASITYDPHSGVYNYEIKAVQNGIFFNTTLLNKSGYLGALSVYDAEWEDSRPQCNGLTVPLNQFRETDWYSANVTVGNVEHSVAYWGARQSPSVVAVEDRMYNRNTLMVEPTWVNKGGTLFRNVVVYLAFIGDYNQCGYGSDIHF